MKEALMQVLSAIQSGDEGAQQQAIWNLIAPHVNSPLVRNVVNVISDEDILTPEGEVDRSRLEQHLMKDVTPVAPQERPCLALNCPHCERTFIISM